MKKIMTALFAVLCAIMHTGARNFDKAGTDTIVSFVTCYPGSDIYELEGHSALRIRYGNTDAAISYGMFDFNSPGFVYRFVKGETDYSVGALPWWIFMQQYASTGRRVVEQELNLTAEEKQKLLELISINLLPENVTYRYNYVKDNCATRPLAIVERAIGKPIDLGHPKKEIDDIGTFRDAMRYYHKNYPWYQFGIDLALGSGIDYAISNREKAFAPVVLEQQLAGASVDGRKLVGKTRVLNDTPEDNAIAGATPWILTPLSVFTILLLLIIWATVRDARRKKVTRWIDSLLFGIFGLVGLLITFLVFVSVHEATSPNLLILWLNPFCLIPAIFIWLKKCKKLVIYYQIANFVILLLLIISWPWTNQTGNIAFIPLVLCDMLRAANYVYINFEVIKNKHKS